MYVHTHAPIPTYYEEEHLLRKKALKKKNNDNDHRLCNTHPLKWTDKVTDY